MLKWRTFLTHWEVGETLLPATTPCPAATDLENQTQPLKQWAPGFSAWSVTATLLIFLPFNLVQYGGNQICHLSSHLGRPSSCQPASGYPILHTLSRTRFPSFPPERVPTPKCALSLSLGEWWCLTPCSGDKFWRNSEGSGKYPGVGNGHPLQYSCLGNSMNRGAWPSTGHGVTTSQTRLSMHTQTQASSFLFTELRVRAKYSTEEICGFCYFWKKFKLIILSWDIYHMPKNSPLSTVF